MSNSKLGQRVYSDPDGSDGRLQSKDVGAASATLGTAAAFQKIVDSDGNAHDLVHGHDPVGASKVLRTSEQGSASVDGVYDGSNNTDPSQVGLVALQQNASPADSHQTLRLTAKSNGTGSVRALDIALRDENGEPFTLTNPLPTFQAESEGEEVNEEDTVNDLAKDASDTQDYSVADGDRFLLKQVAVGGSGDVMVEILIGDGASPEVFTRKALRFGTPSKPADFHSVPGIPVVGTANTSTVRGIRTNIDNVQQTISTTKIGVLA